VPSPPMTAILYVFINCVSFLDTISLSFYKAKGKGQKVKVQGKRQN